MVRSDSPTKTASNVIVQVSAIEPLGTVSDAVRETCMAFSSYRLYNRFAPLGQGVFAAENMKDIHSGQFGKFSVVGLQLWEGDKIVIGNHEHGIRGHIPNGSYRVRLVASADNGRPATLKLAMGVNDKGVVICEIDKSH